MAGQSGSATVQMTATASLVGNAFVNQYYNVLHQSPQVVHRFYTDQSKLSRAEAGPNGEVVTVATQVGIHQKVMSMDYGDIRAEIKTVDSQESLNGSVLVMVTGSLSSHSRMMQNFVQTFFLAPQEKGYFVLNDMFRYLDGEAQATETQPISSPNGALHHGVIPAAPEQGPVEPTMAMQQEVQEFSGCAVEESDSYDDHFKPPDEEEDIAETEEAVAEELVIQPEEVAVPETDEQVPAMDEANAEEAPKKSYASILRHRSEGSNSVVTSSPTSVQKAFSAQLGLQTQAPRPPPPSVGASIPVDEPEESYSAEVEGDRSSVYVKNLPLDITSAELETEFAKFGAIKAGGVNLKNQRLGVCFAFIEFEDANSVQSVIEASPLRISGRSVYVEEKRPMPATLRAGRGRLNQGRGFQPDSSRGGRGYFGGRGSGRGSGQDDFNRGRGGRGTYGVGNAFPSNNSTGNFNTINGYRRTDSQGGTAIRPPRRGAGNQLFRGRPVAKE